MLGEEGGRKKIHEDESRSAVTKLPFNKLGLNTRIVQQRLALSVRLCNPGDTGALQADRGLSPSSPTYFCFGTDSQVRQGFTPKGAGMCPSGLWTFARAENSSNICSEHIVGIKYTCKP